MAITNAVQQGNWILIYDESGNQSGMVPVNDGLTGYTSSSVNVRSGNWIVSFDERGNQVQQVPA